MKISDLKTTLTNLLETDLALLISGPPGIGKCLHRDTPVLDATTGEYVPIAGFDPSHETAAMVNGEFVKVRPSAKMNQGVQSVYRLRTSTGREVLATANHPFYELAMGAKGKWTDARWSQLRDLVPGESKVAVPADLPIFGDDSGTPDDTMLTLVALLLGDGSLSPEGSITFTDDDPATLAEFADAATAKGLGVGIDQKPGNAAVSMRLRNEPVRKPRSGYDPRDLLLRAGVKLARAGEKEMPAWVFRLSRPRLAHFLKRLFSTDGCVHLVAPVEGRKGGVSISYSSKSKKLVTQLQLLLDRFGIPGKIRPLYRELQTGTETYYEWYICHSRAVVRFKEIGFLGRSADKLERGLPIAEGHAANEANRTGNKVWRFGMMFDTVESIEPAGEAETWDLEIPVAHNFVAAGLVVHNSQAVAQVAEAKGLPIVDVRAALLDPVDLRGLPVPDVKARQTTWLAPNFLPRKGRGILFFDEVGHAVPAVQNALFQLFLDRRLGDYSLPPDWHVLAACNRAEDRAGSFRLNAGLASRLVHLHLEVDHEDWHRWAVEQGVAPEIRSFLRFKPQFLWNFDPSKAGEAFPCPRSWTFASRCYQRAAGSGTLSDVLGGCVGPGPAAELMAYVKLYHSLPDLDELLADPARSKLPPEASVRYAVIGALGERARKAKADKLDAIATYALRLPLEFSTMALFELQLANAEFFGCPAVTEWMKTNGRHLNASAGAA